MNLPSSVRVFMATEPTDMRKQMNGLEILVRSGLQRDPRSGEMFVFRSKRGDMARVLFYDRQGFCLFSKRLDTGVFKTPVFGDEQSIEITAKQLAEFLTGINLAQKSN